MDVLTTANYNFDESSASSRNSIASVGSEPCNLDDLSDLEFNSGIER